MRCLKSNVTQSYILPLCIAACFWYNSGTVCLLSMYHTLVHCTLYKCRSQVEFGPNVSYIHRWWSQGGGVFKKPFVWGRARILTSRFGGWKASRLWAGLRRHREISFQRYIFCKIHFRENHKSQFHWQWMKNICLPQIFAFIPLPSDSNISFKNSL